jgi:hypothetical protein
MRNIILAMLLTTQCYSQTKRIVFVCEHGAAKSVIASVYFNKLAKERNLDWEATCRGTNPDTEIGSKIKEGLMADQVFDPTLSPQKLSVHDTMHVKKIILFTKLPENFKTDIAVEDWSAIPNIDGDYPDRRDAIITKINLLLDSLDNVK